MTPIAAAVRELMAAGVTGDALVTAIERLELSLDRRTPGAKRTARWRENKRHKASQSVTCDVVSPPSMVSPITPSLTPPSSDAPCGATEKGLFERGRQVCGQASGGLIAKLLKAKNRDIALARAAIETASTKANPREYLAAIITGGTPSISGRRKTADEEFYGTGIPGII